MGQIVGTYGNSSGTHGFLYNQGIYITEDVPAGTSATWVQGIDNGGQFVGYYSDSIGFHGFIKNGTSFISLDDPAGTSTAANSIAIGVIAGTYFDANGAHGWESNAPNVPVSVENEILGLYAALYNRAAEFPGFSYWVNVVGQQADAAGITLGNSSSITISLNDAQVLGQAFVNTQASFFNQTYASLSDSQFINALYGNIGGNASDPGGISYWANLLQQAETGGQSVQAARAGLVGQFVHDLVNVDLSTFTNLTQAQLLAAQQRQGTIDNKITVSLAYSNASEQPGGTILNPQAIGDAAYQATTTILQGVTSDASTVTTAIIGINTAVAQQNLHLI